MTDIIELIAQWVADDGTDVQRVALADGIRSGRWCGSEIADPIAAWQTAMKVSAAVHDEVRRLREVASRDCKHPTEHVSEYKWHHGYGKYVTGIRCGVCSAAKPFKSDQRWSREVASGSSWDD